jgi:predicted RNA-binding protein with PUA-like domain
MNYWLVKTEPDTYSWDDLIKEKEGVWDGVRNFRARSNMKKMKKGDRVFFYHTGSEKMVVGIAKVSKEAYPEPKDKDWVAVNLTPEKKLKRPVTLAEVKADKRLKEMTLERVARLSVQPVESHEFGIVMEMSTS